MRLTTTLATATTAAVLATLVPASATAAGGRTHGDPATFRTACRTYTYDYRVRTPYDDWSLELRIIDPDGESVHSGAFLGKPGREGHPRRQEDVRYRFCGRSSRPGQFRIKAKLTWYEKPGLTIPFLTPPPEGHVKRLPMERFRLHR